MKGGKIIKLEKGKIIPATDDRIFKSLMISNKRYLSDIISGITGIDKDFAYKNLIIKNSEYLIYNIEEKRRTSDLVVEIKENIINIEMNRFYYKELNKRNNGYLYKMASLYKKDAETFIQINIDNFNKTKNIITKYEMMNVNDLESDESIIKYKVNLALIEEKYYNGINLSKLEKELLLLRLKDKEELKKVSKGDELMKEVNDKIIFLNDERMKELEYDYDEKIRYEATQVGLEQGIEQGIQQEKINIAKNMLNMNMSIEDISKITSLTNEEIEQLK